MADPQSRFVTEGKFRYLILSLDNKFAQRANMDIVETDTPETYVAAPLSWKHGVGTAERQGIIVIDTQHPALSW